MPGAESGVYLYYRTYKPNGNNTEYSAWLDYAVWGGNGDTVLGLGLSGLEYALSTASAKASVADGNILVRKTVSIVFDGRLGATGATGKMFYPMGTWSSSTTYTRTDLSIPMVWRDDPNTYNSAVDAWGNYWYLIADSSQGDDPNTDNGAHWTKANSFGLVITQGIFAEFAKLGKAVMSGDYMFSMNGFVDGVQKNSGASWKEKKAYALFVGDPDDKGFSVSDSKTIGTADVDLYDSGIQLVAGESLVVKLKVTSRTATTRLRIYKGSSTVNFEYSTSNASTSWSKTTSGYLDLDVKTYYIRYTADAAGTCYIKAYKTTGSGSMEYSLSRILFEPNWWVDLLTGKMVAARGNFAVEPDGSVKVKGTISAQNFYHNICIASQGYYQNSIGGEEQYFFKYDNRDNVDSLSSYYLSLFKTGEYYSKSQISEMTSGYFANPRSMYSFIPCTGDADYVQCVPSSGSIQFAAEIVLPRPEDFEGKVIEISGWSRTTQEVNYVVTTVKTKISDMQSSCMSNAITVSSSGVITCANAAASLTFTTGKAYRLASMRLGNDTNNPCIWVKINNN